MRRPSVGACSGASGNGCPCAAFAWAPPPNEPDFTQPQPFASEPAPEGVDPLVWGYSLGRTLVVENALKAHLETHTLLEWVTALTTAQRQLAEEKARQEHYEESVVGALNGRNTRDCRRADTAEAQVTRIRAFLEDMAGWCSPHNVAADYARRGLDALDGLDPLDETEAEFDAAMAEGEPVELVDLLELTREDALELVDDLGQQAYRAEDRLAFVREMCDAADRAGKQITTEQVRAWTQYTGCGGVLRLPDTVMPLLREFAAGDGVAGPATQATATVCTCAPPGMSAAWHLGFCARRKEQR